MTETGRKLEAASTATAAPARKGRNRGPVSGPEPQSWRSGSAPPQTAGPAGLGLYVHVPFCVHKCPYCDFVSGPVETAPRRLHLKALEQEIRNSPWRTSRVRTVFFGGGTPSELQPSELERLVQALRDAFRIAPEAEWTIECNPGTLPEPKLGQLRRLGFNRVSLGVQSFQDRHLQTLGRIHDAGQALDCYRRLRRVGFDNLNLDLIFAVPGQTLQDWWADLLQALDLEPEHLSLYNLTVEDGTEFGRLKRAGQLRETGEPLAAEMFELAMTWTEAAGFEQYEISNFARPGRRCRHNLIYWRSEEYLGFGLSAASFVGGARWSNTHHLDLYARGAQEGNVPRQSEERLAPRAALGESLMLALRTSDGVRPDELARRHGLQLPPGWVQEFEFFTDQGFLQRQGGLYQLTRPGRLVADSIAGAFLD